MESSGNPLVPLFMLAVVVFVIAGMWRVFTKAGKPGWACLVPIYNVIVLLQIAGRPVWWFLLMFIPFVNIIVTFVVVMDIARTAVSVTFNISSRRYILPIKTRSQSQPRACLSRQRPIEKSVSFIPKWIRQNILDIWK